MNTRRPRTWRAELAYQFQRAIATALVLAGLLLLSSQRPAA